MAAQNGRPTRTFRLTRTDTPTSMVPFCLEFERRQLGAVPHDGLSQDGRDRHFALLGLVARRHGRRDLMMLGLLGAAFLVFFFGWDAIRGIFHRDAFTTPGGATPGTSFGIRDHIKAYLVWLWQTLLPFKLPF